jgi:transposase
MTQPISADLRRRIIKERLEAKKSYEDLAEQFLVGRATVNRLLRTYRETGDVQPKPHGGGMPLRISDDELPAVKEIVDANADATLAELAVLCSKALARPISRATVGRTMVRLRLLPKEEGAHSVRAKSPQRRRSTARVPCRHRGR